MLWYLHQCTVTGITVDDNYNNAISVLQMTENDSGRCTTIISYPTVTTKNKNLIDKTNEEQQLAN